MAQSHVPPVEAETERVSAVDIDEGDRVAMGINWHGEAKDGVYLRDAYRSAVIGTVTEALSETERELLDDGGRPMADLSVRTDDGEVYTWNVDNGYVIGPHAGLGRRSDVGKIGGFYEVDGDV